MRLLQFDEPEVLQALFVQLDQLLRAVYHLLCQVANGVKTHLRRIDVEVALTVRVKQVSNLLIVDVKERCLDFEVCLLVLKDIRDEPRNNSDVHCGISDS